VLDCASADIVISSTHKWSLGIHGGCVVGVRSSSAGKLTARAGGWYNRTDPFGTRRFERADTRPGAASFATGMPNFAAIYALNSGLRYLETIGVDRVAAHADPLVAEVGQGLRELGLQAMSPPQPGCSSGIVSFRHGRAAAIGRALRSDDIHVMSPDDRIRISVHGYNTREDVERLLKSLRAALRSSAVR
jgi:selenocysteine lyase/cysteine desulfurase